MKSSSLIIPERPGTEITAGFSDDIRRQVAKVASLESVDEGHRRLGAWKQYVKNREQKDELEVAQRWCEIRIGELLGKAKHTVGPGRGKKRLPENNRFMDVKDKYDRHRFRLMSDNQLLIIPAIERREAITRAAVLAIIKRHFMAAKAGKGSVKTRLFKDFGKLLATGKQYGTIYVDPPWKYGNQGTRASTDNHYATMTVEEITAMEVGKLAGDNSHLHLWTTNAFLFEAKKVIDAWGFEYKSVFVWVKPQMGIGNYWRVSHEFLLLGVKGSLSFADHSQMSWRELKRGEHSSKPREVRLAIEKVSPGPRLEMFGRCPVDGWDVFGDGIVTDLLDVTNGDS